MQRKIASHPTLLTYMFFVECMVLVEKNSDYYFFYTKECPICKICLKYKYFIEFRFRFALNSPLKFEYSHIYVVPRILLAMVNWIGNYQVPSDRCRYCIQKNYYREIRRRMASHIPRIVPINSIGIYSIAKISSYIVYTVLSDITKGKVRNILKYCTYYSQQERDKNL